MAVRNVELFQQEVVKEKLGSKISSLLRSARNESDIWKNLLKVEVYFEQFNYQLIEETPSYPVRKQALVINETPHLRHNPYNEMSDIKMLLK